MSPSMQCLHGDEMSQKTKTIKTFQSLKHIWDV